jgi:hypothetical protein
MAVIVASHDTGAQPQKEAGDRFASHHLQPSKSS